MADTMAADTPAQAEELVAAKPGLIQAVCGISVAQLKMILGICGLRQTGTKALLQIRMINHIITLPSREKLDEIWATLVNRSVLSLSAHKSDNIPSKQTFGPIMGYPVESNGSGAGQITFKGSPLYTIEQQLTQVHECQARESTKDTARLMVLLSQDTIDKLIKDPSHRVMVFCASENTGACMREPSDVAFPDHVELKCNGMKVEANLRGLKSRPGSTRPADITNSITLTPCPQTVEMTYAGTTK
ncbi:uncharacterized protein PV07_12746, partial [Cladophialophora immunda]